MQNLNCPNCGAPINRATMRCEYCGTQFKIDDYKLVYVNDPNIAVLNAEVRVHMDVVDHVNEDRLKDFVLDEMTHKMAKALLDEIEVSVRPDYGLSEVIVTGRVRVVKRGKKL